MDDFRRKAIAIFLISRDDSNEKLQSILNTVVQPCNITEFTLRSYNGQECISRKLQHFCGKKRIGRKNNHRLSYPFGQSGSVLILPLRKDFELANPKKSEFHQSGGVPFL